MSFTETQLIENIEALLKYINAIKPASSKGVYVRNVSLSATMMPGITIAA
jgi:large subunit ribosomal protein L1